MLLWPPAPRNERGPIARVVPPARQQTRLRVVPPTILADGRRRQRPQPIRPLRSEGRQGTDRRARQTHEPGLSTRVRPPNPLSPGAGSQLRLRLVWFRRRRRTAEPKDGWDGPYLV